MLTLIEQEDYTNEKLCIDGVVTTVHNIVKNSPFQLTFLINEHAIAHENNFSVDCKLFYDTVPFKPVDYLSVKPLDFKIVPSRSPTTLVIEAKVKVLTSQREDILFRVGVQIADAMNNPIGECAFSDPVRVVSKTEQTKKGQSDRIHNAEAVPATKNLPVLISALPHNPGARTQNYGRVLTLTQNDFAQEMKVEPNTQENPNAPHGFLHYDKPQQVQQQEQQQTQQSTLTLLEQLQKIESEMQTQYADLSNAVATMPSQNDATQMQVDDSGFFPVLKRQKESLNDEDIEVQFGKTLAKICAFFRETPLSERDENITHLLDVLSPVEMDKLDDFITNLENLGLRNSLTTQQQDFQTDSILL